MKNIKVVVFILIMMGFGFIITAQRLESRNIDLQISQLQNDIESINSRKRELHIAIESEVQRLSIQDQYNSSMPISLNDIIKIEVSETPSGEIALAQPAEENTFDRLIAWLSSPRN